MHAGNARIHYVYAYDSAAQRKLRDCQHGGIAASIVVSRWIILGCPSHDLLMASGVPGDLPFQVILAGRHGVGKSYIFERLQKEADQYGSGLHTVDTGTGRSAASGRDKWMVHTTCGGGRNATVRPCNSVATCSEWCTLSYSGLLRLVTLHDLHVHV